jgi:molybdopterin/thiamine biosynthesis adenylyltransferase
MIRTGTRPRMKRVFPWLVVGDTVYVQRCGDQLAIADPDGKIRRVLALLDGSRTCGQVLREVREDHPATTLAEVEEYVGALDDARVLEDGAVAAPDDRYALSRWSRDLGFLETYASLSTSKYELHRRIQDCRVALLGLGGVGSHLMMDLLGLGVAEIRAIDFDTVDLSNLNRQILYDEKDVGRLKTDAAAERAGQYNSRTRVTTVNRRLTSAGDVRDFVSASDIVIAAVDQPKTHIANWVNAGCVAAGKTFVTGGVDTQRSFFYTVVPGVSGCVECWRRQAVDTDGVSAAIAGEMARRETALAPGERFGQDMAAFGPLVTTHTACVLTEFVRLVTGIAPAVATGRMMAVSFASFEVRETETWRRLEDCGVCGVPAREPAGRAEVVV